MMGSRSGRSSRCSGLVLVALAALVGLAGSEGFAAARSGGGVPPFLGGASSAAPAAPGTATSSVPVAGFQDAAVISGLTNPTSVRVASDGRVVVAEKSGIVKGFHGFADTDP